MLFAGQGRGRWRLCTRVLVVVGVVITLKLVAHRYGWEILSLNPLFSGIIAANVSLMGFLLSGVITFLLVFLNLLIHDLHNPFGYYEGDSAEDVSLKPLDDLMAHLKSLAGGPPPRR